MHITTANAYLFDKTPEQWAQEVARLPHKVRCAIACMVWFDFFGDRPAKEPWPHLDSYVESYRLGADQCTVAELREGLVAVGFTEELAAERLQFRDDKPYKPKRSKRDFV